MIRQAGMQAPNLAAGQMAARRVVGIGQHDDPGARGHGRQESVDIGQEIAVAHGHRPGAFHEGVLGELLIATGRIDQLVARPQVGAGEAGEQLVGAGAAGDAGRIEAEARGDRRGEIVVLRLRIEVPLGHGPMGGLDRVRARPQGAFVGGEQGGAGHAVHVRQLDHMAGEIQHARPRLRSRHPSSLLCHWRWTRRNAQEQPASSSSSRATTWASRASPLRPSPLRIAAITRRECSRISARSSPSPSPAGTRSTVSPQ